MDKLEVNIDGEIIEIETMEDVLISLGGVLYFINKHGEEIDCISSDDDKVKVLNVRHIGYETDEDEITFNAYEITVDM